MRPIQTASQLASFKWPEHLQGLPLPRSLWGLSALLVLAHGVLALASLGIHHLAQTSSNSPALWLPGGLTYAAALTLGHRALPGLFLGQLIFEWMDSGQPLVGALLGLGDVLSAGILAWAMGTTRGVWRDASGQVDSQRLTLANPGQFLRALGAFLVGATCNALCGTLAYAPAEAATLSGLASFVGTWVIGDLSAGLMVGPLLLRAYTFSRADWGDRGLEFSLALGIALLAMAGALQTREIIPPAFVVTLLLPLLVGAALRYTQFQSVLANALLCGVALLEAAKTPGRILGQQAPEALVLEQAFLVALLMAALLLSIHRRQSDIAQRRLLQINTTLEQTEEVARIGSWHQNLRTGQLAVSPETLVLFGLPRDAQVLSYRQLQGAVHPEDTAAVDAAWNRAVAAQHPFDIEHRVLVDGSVRWLRTKGRFERDADGQALTAWGSVQDISDQMALREALQARSEAESASRAKSAFLATLSHEIRTPLNGVSGLAQLAQDPQLDEATRQEYLRQLRDSAGLLNAVITDVLDLSRIEVGQLPVAREPFDLHALLKGLAGVHRALGEMRGLSVRLEGVEGTPPQVVGDATRLRQVLGNFLSNALKFTEAGEVVLAVRAVPPMQAPQGPEGRLRFEVRDTGIGLSAANAQRVFEPFMQADEANTRRFGGTGLGLAICRELARLMGGEVGVHSQLGRGSTFWLELPCPPAPAAEPAPAALTSGTPTTTEAAAPLEGLHLLLVEDNRTNTLVARRMLERAGARVSAVEDGQAAVHAVVASREPGGTPFDLVLMDVHMPVMDGLAATQRIRALEAAPPGLGHLPIVAMTAGVLEEQRQAALDAGMDDFLAKPLAVARLIDTVQAHTRRSLTL